MVGTIDIEKGKLRFTLTGVDKVLALKSELKGTPIRSANFTVKIKKVRRDL
jgi:hypothetical protein